MADANNNEYPTVLGADAVFKGELAFEKGVRLLGKFEGEIDSGGRLLIAGGASLDGNVKADTIRIDGNVKGNLDAKAKVQLSESARVEGDVQAARLEVAEGAVLVGRCMVGVNGHATKSSDKSVSAASSSQRASVTSQGKVKQGMPAVAGKR
ncbi:MAG: polymer-forming cytoskeletal protein [Phycisphaerae bacterium]